MAIFTESYCQNILEGFMDKYKENRKRKKKRERKMKNIKHARKR